MMGFPNPIARGNTCNTPLLTLAIVGHLMHRRTAWNLGDFARLQASSPVDAHYQRVGSLAAFAN